MIMESLYQTMTSGGEPICGGEEGLLGTVTAIAIQQAMEQKQIINVNNIWEYINL